MLPTLQKLTPNANLLFSVRSSLTIENPDTFAGGGCWRHISNTDTLTGSSPTTAAALPLGVEPPGGGLTGNGGYGFYLINNGGYSPADITGVNAIFPITQTTETIRGVPVNSINIRCTNTQTAGGFLTQGWLAFYRNLSKVGIADLPELCIEYDITLPDLTTLLDTTNRYLTVSDWKTGSGTTGDDRVAFGVMMSNGGSSGWHDEDSIASGTLIFFAQGDNKADSNNGITGEEYYRIKNPTETVPLNETFRIRIYRKRGLSYSDTDTHRLRIEIKKKNEGAFRKLFDIHKQSLADWSAQYPYQSPLGASPAGGWPARNIGMGIYNRKYQRLMTGIYFGGGANKDIQIKYSCIDIWDGYPGILPSI